MRDKKNSVDKEMYKNDLWSSA